MSFPNPDTLFRQLLPYFLSRDEFTQIAQTTLTGSVASVTFGTIPQTFRTLFYYLQLRTDRAAETDFINLHFNGDGAANYDRQFLRASDLTVSSNAFRATATSAIGQSEAANARASNFSPIYGFITGYALADREKYAMNYSTAYGDVSADTDIFLNLDTIRWQSTAAITSCAFSPNIGANLVSGCILQLYGLR